MKLACILAAAALAMGGAAAQAASPSGLAIADPALKAAKPLAVSSPKFAADGVIPDDYSSYGKSVSPPLAWGKGPYGTKSFALILEDPDAPTPVPFQHWLIWNIPATVTKIAEGAPPTSAAEGKLMIVNRTGYMGPRPPPGPAHHYHFQVFALDRPLELAAGADRGALVDAMKGHVLAAGELIATYQKK
jgi:Raf kinase inhibitor-like YbhB/YbcL family protein